MITGILALVMVVCLLKVAHIAIKRGAASSSGTAARSATGSTGARKAGTGKAGTKAGAKAGAKRSTTRGKRGAAGRASAAPHASQVVGKQVGAVATLLGRILTNTLDEDAHRRAKAAKAKRYMKDAQAKGRTAKTRNAPTSGVLVDKRRWRDALGDLREMWFPRGGKSPRPADTLPDAAPQPDAAAGDPQTQTTPNSDTVPDAPSAPGPTPAGGGPVPPPRPANPTVPDSHDPEILQGVIVMTTPNGVPQALMHTTAAHHLQHLQNFHPEADAELLRLLASEVNFDVGRAQAMVALYDNCVTTIGLDPTAVEQVNAAGEAAQAAAEAMSLAYRRFIAVYQAVMETAANGTVMPYNGRFMTGEAA